MHGRTTKRRVNEDFVDNLKKKNYFRLRINKIEKIITVPMSFGIIELGSKWRISSGAHFVEP